MPGVQDWYTSRRVQRDRDYVSGSPQSPCRSPGAKKKPRDQSIARFRKNFGGVLLSHQVTLAVPSALRGLTSEFDMGSGGTLSTSPPKICWRCQLAKAVATVPLCWHRAAHLNLSFAFNNSELVRGAPSALTMNRVVVPVLNRAAHRQVRSPFNTALRTPHTIYNVCPRNMAKPHDLLVLVSSVHYCTSTPSLSTL